MTHLASSQRMIGMPRGGKGDRMLAVLGTDDLRHAADDLASRLPEPLAPLARLAYNYRWAWLPGGSDLFRCIDDRRWRLVGGNPVRLLQEASAGALNRAAEDGALIERAASLQAQVRADLEREPSGPVSLDRPVAYLSAEFAVHQSLPIYSGGLGAL